MNLPDNRRILLIDDMPSIHDDFRKLFAVPAATPDLDEDEALLFGDAAPAPASALGGFQLDSALQGQEGLQRVQQAVAEGRPYAMAFVDMRMPPGWDGVETIERLWQADPRLQVVICTAYTEHSWEDVLRRLDTCDRLLVLKKPFDAIEVLQLARTLVTKWGLGRDAERQRRELEAEVMARTRELRVRDRAIEAAQNPVLITDASRGHEHPIVYVNPAFERVTGYSAAEVAGRHPKFLLGSDTQQPTVAAITAAMQSTRPAHGVTRNYRKDGSLFWNEVHVAPVLDDNGHATHHVTVMNDVTSARNHEQALLHQAQHDALTGLPNRLLLRDRLDQAITQARRTRERVALLWLDLDHFKFVNDSYGHAVGDGLLVALADRLKATVRHSDTVARLGGDEFVILLAGVDGPGGAATAAQKVLAALASPIQVQDHQLHASTSIGIGLFPEDGQTSDELLMHADTAMYRAKADGRNGWRFYDAELSQRSRQREALHDQLHVALAQGQFELHYQPRVDIASGAVDGVEALIRWRHPERGLVSPADFIPVAEETGLIVPIGDWVLRTACAQARAWRERWPFRLQVSVNVSARQFRQHDLPAAVQRALADSGLDGSLLQLELTESLLLQQTDAVNRSLQAIKALGVSLALDDFGTGFSSLAYLRRFPIDTLKIDRSFIGGVDGATADAALTRAIIGMARSLGLKVVGEGVESPAQLAFLQAHQCDAAQGWLLGRPLPAAELDALWTARSRSAIEPAPAAH